LVDQTDRRCRGGRSNYDEGRLECGDTRLAIEYAKEGIRVNTIALGVINTPMHKPETHEFLKGLHPVGRIGEVKEVVDAALFLTDATFTSVKYCTWMAARTLANGDRNASLPFRKRLDVIE